MEKQSTWMHYYNALQKKIHEDGEGCWCAAKKKLVSTLLFFSSFNGKVFSSLFYSHLFLLFRNARFWCIFLFSTWRRVFIIISVFSTWIYCLMLVVEVEEIFCCRRKIKKVKKKNINTPQIFYVRAWSTPATTSHVFAPRTWGNDQTSLWLDDYHESRTRSQDQQHVVIWRKKPVTIYNKIYFFTWLAYPFYENPFLVWWRTSNPSLHSQVIFLLCRCHWLRGF